MATFTIKQLCERYRAGEHTVLGWIRTGELKAINIAKNIGGSRPTWRVTQDAVEAFERLRSSAPEPKRKGNRRRETVDVIDRY
jgi:transposase